MPKYILVYHIRDYPEMGGGLYIEYPISEDAMHKRVEELHKGNEDKVKIECAGWLQTEYEYTPIQYATKFEVNRK